MRTVSLPNVGHLFPHTFMCWSNFSRHWRLQKKKGKQKEKGPQACFEYCSCLCCCAWRWVLDVRVTLKHWETVWGIKVNNGNMRQTICQTIYLFLLCLQCRYIFHHNVVHVSKCVQLCEWWWRRKYALHKFPKRITLLWWQNWLFSCVLVLHSSTFYFLNSDSVHDLSFLLQSECKLTDFKCFEVLLNWPIFQWCDV